MINKLFSIFIFLAISISVFAQNENQNHLVVFLVRHAEKVDNSRNPELSEAGVNRANTLAQILADAGIDQIHSTDFLRTKQTAQPLAECLDCEIEVYDAKNLETFAQELKKKSGRHLVVGHSNTTPQLVKFLGGEPGSEIDEKLEYDRLYLLTYGKKGTVSSVLLRYGTLFQKE